MEGKTSNNRALRSTFESVATHVAAHGFTFLLNLYVTRKSSKVEFGVAAVSFELLHSLVLFLPTEGFRRAALRHVDKCSIDTSKPESNKNADVKQEPQEIQTGGTKCSGVSLIETIGASRNRKKTCQSDRDVHTKKPKDGLMVSYDADYQNASACQSGMNVVWLGVLFAFFSSIVLMVIWIVRCPSELIKVSILENKSSLRNYYTSVLLVSLGSMAESLAEPFLTYCYILGHSSCRPRADAVSSIVQTIFKGLYFLKTGNAIKAFAMGILAHGVAWLVVLVLEFYKFASQQQHNNSGVSMMWFVPFQHVLPGKLDLRFDDATQSPRTSFWQFDISSFISPSHMSFLGSYVTLSVQKGFLSEGEKLLMMLLFSASDWGAYGLVTSFGSIICRIVFLPIEETAKAIFSRQKMNFDTEHSPTTSSPESLGSGLSPSKSFCDKSETSSSKGNDKSETSSSKGNDKSETSSSKGNDLFVKHWRQHFHIFRGLLFLQGLIGLFGVAFGPRAASGVVTLVYGELWASGDAPFLLNRYCYLLFLMAINGIGEAYMYSQASAKWLKFCQASNMAIWAAFVGAVYALRKLFSCGVSSIIYASYISVFFRICLCFAFTYHQVFTAPFRSQSMSNEATSVSDNYSTKDSKITTVLTNSQFCLSLLTTRHSVRAAGIVTMGGVACTFVNLNSFSYPTVHILEGKFGSVVALAVVDIFTIVIIFVTTFLFIVKDVYDALSDFRHIKNVDS